MPEYSLEAVKALVVADKFTLKVLRCQEAIVRHFGCTAKVAREKFRERSRREAVR